MFSSEKLPFRTRVSLLEERLSSYDEISKQMLSKLEQAVEKISESNKNISQILIRHEERIDRSSEVNESTLDTVSKIDADLKDRLKAVEGKVEVNSSSIEDLKKNRWLTMGVVIAASYFLSQFKVFERLVPHQVPQIQPVVEYARPESTLRG